MESALKELANERLAGFHTICMDLKAGLLTCQEAKEYINILNQEFVDELESLGVNFHITYPNMDTQATTKKVALQVADLLSGNPCGEM